MVRSSSSPASVFAKPTHITERPSWMASPAMCGAGSGLAVALEAPDQLPRLTVETEVAAFRIVQEAVTNALRHAQARQVTVQVRLEDAGLRIAVRDDGCGFVADETLDRAAADGHLGLVGIRERTRALGGAFHLSSAPGAGTEVRVELPAGAAP